jgi:hypothetical protein
VGFEILSVGFIHDGGKKDKTHCGHVLKSGILEERYLYTDFAQWLQK